MKIILIYLGIVIGPYLVIWIIKQIANMVQIYKYRNKLNLLKPEIDCIDIDNAEKKYELMYSSAAIISDRLNLKYRIPMDTDVPSINEYIQDDALTQGAIRGKDKPGRRNFKRRYRR
ncbi:MAG: hypothetical protein ABSE63_05755 [Thermoguttaceae bacterium]